MKLSADFFLHCIEVDRGLEHLTCMLACLLQRAEQQLACRMTWSCCRTSLSSLIPPTRLLQRAEQQLACRMT